MSDTFDIIVLGDYFYDLIFSGLEAFPALGQEKFSQELVTTGGAAYITACALTRLGVHVGWLGQFGSDEYSTSIYRLSQSEGIDLSLARVLDRPYRRVTAALPLEGERAFVTHVDAEPPDQMEYWSRTLERANYRHVHIGGALPEEQLAPLAAIVHRQGATLSMDCSDVPFLYTPYPWAATLAHVDAFMPNAREASLITGYASPEAALSQLGMWCPLVVLKDGADGALIAQSSGAEGPQHVLRSPGIDAGPCVDTTGAGDCFNAGFLYGWIIERSSLERSALYGNICGGLSVTAQGGATKAPSLVTLTAWAKRPA